MKTSTKVDDALSILRALVREVDPDAREVNVPIRVAEAVLYGIAERRTDDLINALAALDLVDCSPRMVQRRVVLISRLRLDATDDEARAQASDLLGAATLRRRLHEALVDALDRDDVVRAQKMRAILIDADGEVLGWQADGEAALDGPLPEEGRGRRCQEAPLRITPGAAKRIRCTFTTRPRAKAAAGDGVDEDDGGCSCWSGAGRGRGSA